MTGAAPGEACADHKGYGVHDREPSHLPPGLKDARDVIRGNAPHTSVAKIDGSGDILRILIAEALRRALDGIGHQAAAPRSDVVPKVRMHGGRRVAVPSRFADARGIMSFTIGSTAIDLRPGRQEIKRAMDKMFGSAKDVWNSPLIKPENHPNFVPIFGVKCEQSPATDLYRLTLERLERFDGKRETLELFRRAGGIGTEKSGSGKVVRWQEDLALYNVLQPEFLNDLSVHERMHLVAHTGLREVPGNPSLAQLMKSFRGRVRRAGGLKAA